MTISTVRLDVNLFNAKDETTKKANCVPLKDFDDTKNLADVRTALIANGGLDSSRVACPFCSSSGAIVNDETSFSDYLEVVSDDSKEKEPKEEPEAGAKVAPSPGEGASSGKKVYNVYVYLKAKEDSGGLSEESRKLIKKELNLKLSDKPELLQASIEQLTSSFDRADWLAKAGKTINPADMSEKDWNSVIRNNSLTSASRLVFSNLGQPVDGKRQLQFRRIERAPYSAFVLKPRKFQAHEVVGAQVKIAQTFYIPRYVVTDDSYIDVFETKSSVSNSMARSSFSSIEAEASAEGGAFGFSASASVGFSKNQSSALGKTSVAEDSSMNITYNFPRVILHMDHESLELSDECIKDIGKVKDVDSLVAFHHKYGHFFATRIELGGRLFSSEKFSSLSTAEKTKTANAMKIAASASFSSTYASGSASASNEDSSAGSDEKSNSSMQRSISWEAQGGDTLLANNPREWCRTVAPSQSWRIIKQEDVIPLGEFIGRMKEFEDIPKKFKALAELTRKEETVSFRLKWNNETAKPKYLSIHDVTEMRSEVESLYPQNQPYEPPPDVIGGIVDKRPLFCPDEIKELYDAGQPGLLFDDNSRENVFDVVVETLLNQPPKLEYQKRYRLYNRKRALWLRAVTFTFEGKEITLLAAGPESTATLFEFRNRMSEGTIGHGQLASLKVYGADGRDKGFTALALQQLTTQTKGAKSIGAIPYSGVNDDFITYTRLEVVEQKNVP